MSRLTIQLPGQAEQDEFNQRRWDELLADNSLARIEGRIETDRHGYILMSPPPSARHGSFQAKISILLHEMMPEGQVITECPVSTADGVRAVDAAWASAETMRRLGNRSCFPSAPEICVEVLSPRNSRTEMEEKKRLYFDAGAQEVWTCDEAGKITFYLARAPDAAGCSELCPAFPKEISDSPSRTGQ
jgi:Uma2 family endonuclease